MQKHSQNRTAEAVASFQTRSVKPSEPKFTRRLWLSVGLVICFASLAFGEAQKPGVHPSRVLAKPRPEVRTARPDELKAAHHGLGAKVRREHPEVGGLQVIELPNDVPVEQALQHYKRSGLFEYVEPDYEVQISVTPNDPAFVDGLLWGMQKINAPAAWDVRNNAEEVVVAVIDTGIRYTHEDLASNMWRNPGETGLDANGKDKATNGIDDDGDGYVDDVYGINAITGSGDPNDDFFHGTHCAGTIGGVGNNAVGVAGVAWHVKLMACKFLGNNGSGYISDAIECVDYARSKGAKIMSNSWSGGGYSQALWDAIAAARDAGIIFVAAAGNNYGNDNDVSPTYPASYDLDNIVAVAATDSADELADFSNVGRTSVDLGAPGVSIYSCLNYSDSAYGYASGTSMATPHVAGAFALLKAQFPSKTYADLIRRMFDTVDPVSALAGRSVTGGRLNLARALELAPPTGLTPGSPTPDGSVIVNASPITLSWNGSVGADRYQLIVYRWDWASGNWAYDTSIATSATFVSYSPPVDKTHYAWTVQAGNASRWSALANWAFLYVDIPCSYTLSSSRTRFSGAGGVGSVSVSAMPGCDWTAQSNAGWITITAGSTGTGNGVVSYSVDAYSGKNTRTGTLTIAGQSFTVTQMHK